MNTERKGVSVEVTVSTKNAMEQTTKLVEKLKEASSLANELAESLSKLEINIKA